MKRIRIAKTDLDQLLESMYSFTGYSSFDHQRLKIRFSISEQTVADLWLPLHFPVAEANEKAADYLWRNKDSDRCYFICLIQAGAAALGYVEKGILKKHKVIKTYMVRKKQGKSQLKHLKTRGKSRLGSRIRLKNAEQFFEDINAKIHEWDCLTEDSRICYACSKQLWPHLFQTDIEPAFDKKDPRLISIPLDIHKPSFNELQRMIRFIPHYHMDIYDEGLYEQYISPKL